MANVHRFSIIIVTYNSEQHIKTCLESVFGQDFLDYEVVVIDNASSDETLSQLNPFKDKLRTKVNDKNEGFSGALNSGIALSSGEYVLTINPDVILRPTFLSELDKRTSKLDKRVGMIGVKILRKKRGLENVIDSTGLILTKAIRFYDRGSGKRDSGQYDEGLGILGPCAAAGIYKREMLDDISSRGCYFDSDYFYLLEDFDVALRARNKGWQYAYMPEAVCYHERNGSGVSHAERQYFSFRNRYFLIIKNIKIRPCLLFYFLFYDIPRLFFLLLTNRHTIKALREIRDIYPVMLNKRSVA